MSQIESIEWLAYPENKPEKGKRLLITNTSKQIWKGFFNGKEFVTEVAYRTIESVTAFAELPKPYDPLAKTFNFMTACKMIGKTVKSKFSQRVFNVYLNNLMLLIDGVEHQYIPSFSQAEIESDWEQA